MATKTIQLQDLGRAREIAQVLGRNGFGHVLSLIGLTTSLPSVAHTETPTGPFARRLRQALVELGPTFVKFGQVLSVRPDILPKDVLLEFQTLQDQVPPMSPDEARGVLESELGAPVSETFAELDPSPLGSASIAQVHRAVLVDGTEVAVKIQRPGIEQTIRSDLHILYSLAQLLESRVKIPGFYTPVDIVREFDAAIMQELDFHTEARNAERMASGFRDSPEILVPRTFSRWSTRRVLVMELVRGKPLRKVLQEKAPDALERQTAHRLMESTYRQVFETGFFHGDPHPGNLYVTEDDRLAFLDFGVTGMLTGGMQDTLISAFTSLVFRDADTLSMTIYRAGATQSDINLREFRDECEYLMVKYHGASLDDIANLATLVEVVQLAAKYEINLPREFAVLARAIGLVEGAIRELLPGVDIVAEVMPYAQRLMRQRFSPERVAADTAKLFMQAQSQFRDLPTQVNQLMLDLERGRLTLVTKDPDAGRLRQEVSSAVLRLSLVALASTTSLGAMLLLAAWSPTPFGIPLFGLLGLGLLGSGLAIYAALGLHVFFARFLSVSFWRRRILSVFRFFSRRRDSDP